MIEKGEEREVERKIERKEQERDKSEEAAREQPFNSSHCHHITFCTYQKGYF